MRKYLIIAAMLLNYTVYCQVGIGIAAPDPSAVLDVSSSSKGLLIPRIALTGTTDAATITAPATGLLIYNTATAGTAPNTVMPGYYYWNGTNWTTMDGGSAYTWNTTGNSGTTAGTHFIGTTDNTDLVWKRNNAVAGILGATRTVLGSASLPFAATGVGNTAIGSNSLKSVTTGSENTAIGYFTLNTITTAAYNIAIGNNTLANDTSGDSNTAVGNSGLVNNTSGRMNTAIGHDALYYNTTGNYNTGIGVYSGYNNSYGANNVAIGTSSLNKNVRGDNNTAIGAKALENLAGNPAANSSNNVAVGISAGDNLLSGAGNIFIGNLTKAVVTTGNNQLNIGNTIYGTNVNAGGYANIGINTTTPANTLEVKSIAGGTSGVRITNLPSMGLLGTNSQGDIIPAFNAMTSQAPVTSYTALESDETILINAASGAVTVFLPVSPRTGKKFTVKKTDATANNVYLSAPTVLIDNQAGPTSIFINVSMKGLVVQFDGTQYWIIGRI
ncbi:MULTISPECIES: hypothetical protein [unclassified Flavobacterium]|uniref:hypothetical protein n=1 Tax=unclassified Flavobacterium TaxID=196869 RepID=UPI000869B34A|nr:MULTISPECIES: hypothetical protein [unclassified Flavobacterium]MBN9286199.1 hypothetical protein [Flavobacterium sp.]ODS84174.1 MAG: hypothetical protein ABS44_16715 [Chryseobacterium sp. SCN 40-13]OJV67246.1 MAG: hypothetical protein BGO42_11005 [Flavobacterium sp. 40-81]